MENKKKVSTELQKPFFCKFSMASLGQIGEDIAAQYLQKKGYKIIERNYRKPWGEIDIITGRKKNIIFVEVKTLQQNQDANNRFLPEENITFQKKKKLIRTTKMYLWERKYSKDQVWRIDVIEIEFIDGGKCRLRHTKNAITE